ncbi:MAG: AAA family ATPase [Fimbriimonas sp.]
MDGARPKLIVVTGRPGVGKSTLVHPLARAIRCPVVSRDEIKEGMVDALGDSVDEPAVAKATYEAFFGTVRFLLERKVTLVAEAAFQHRLWGPLEELGAISDLRILVLAADSDVVASRREQRAVDDPARGRFHGGPVPAAYDPPRFDAPTLTIDTGQGYRPAFEEIVAFISRIG